jgi:hypothetical protein
MMIKILLVTVNLLLALFLSAQKDPYSFIPNNYDTLYDGVAKGDLNKDGIQDAVLAVYPIWENDSDWIEKADSDSLPQRMLIILFGTRSGFTEAAKSSHAIMCKNCGGVFGDPFAGILIKGNVLQINHYGGSNWRWEYAHKFRYQAGKFYLIGQISHSYWDVKNCDKLNDFAGTEYEDINYLTGQFERKKISEDCKLLENKKGKKKTAPLVALAGFDISN